MSTILFGLNISPSAGPGADPVRDAVAAEAAGFDFVSTSDHPSGTDPTFENWTMLTWMAAATTRIKVASRVLGVPLRPPAMVAKMAESLDRLSGGRLVLGLGGGSGDGELAAFGLPVPSPAAKIDGLADAIRIIRGLWSEPALTYHGAVYRAEAAPLAPKPAHAIPIWLGTFGPRGLTLTGQLADGWIPSLGYKPAEQLPGMLKVVRDAAVAAGRRPEDLTCVLNVQVCVGEEPDGAGAHVLAGPARQVADQLLTFVDAGFDGFSILPSGRDWRQQVDRLAGEVIPLVRS